jgi:hypothetical protein
MLIKFAKQIYHPAAISQSIEAFSKFLSIKPIQEDAFNFLIDVELLSNEHSGYKTIHSFENFVLQSSIEIAVNSPC